MSIPTETYNGMLYQCVSRPDRTKKGEKELQNFGDIISDIAKEYGLNTISSFVKLNVAGRDPKYKGSCDTKRKGFLDFLVASKILEPMKVGSEKGYKILQEPSTRDLENAYNFSIDTSENGRGFAAFEEGDYQRYSTVKKSIQLETYLLNTFINKYEYNQLGTEYDFDEFKNFLMRLFTEGKTNKLTNWLTIKGVMTQRLITNEDGVVIKRFFKFNRNINSLDLDKIPLTVYIPAGCVNVIKETEKPVKYYDNVSDLMEFFTNNISYLIKSGKYDKKGNW